MVWLTWRQHRAQAVVTALLIGLVAVLLTMNVVPLDVVKMLPWAPVLVGLFWGVPLLTREFERGTDKLAWTQSVPRLRWLAAKFGGLAVAVAVAGLALGFVVNQWLVATQATPMNRFSGDLFGVTGVAPAAWFLVVFALGAASGAALRRTLPAMAVTIAVFAVLVVGAFLARGHYAEPVIMSVGSRGDVVPADALIVDQGVRNAEGVAVSYDDSAGLCGGQEPVSCLESRGYDRAYVAFQPADRYWRFQWTEAGLLLLITVLLAGVTAHQVVRRG